MVCKICSGKRFVKDGAGDFVLCRSCPKCEHGIAGICYSCAVETMNPCVHGVRGLCESCEAERDLRLERLEEERIKYLKRYGWSLYLPPPAH